MGDSYQSQQAFQSSESSATILHALILEKYGEEAYGWDPLTVAMEVQADFQVEMSSESVDRWSAIQVVMSTDAFFKRLDAFLSVCATLNSGEPAFETFNPVTVEEAAWAIAEVALNREALPYAYSIKQYLKRLLKEDGYDEGTYPDIFDEVFGPRPTSDAIRETLQPDNTDLNKTNLDLYIEDQLADLVSQFAKVPHLRGIDHMVVERGLDEALQASTKGLT